MNKQTNEWTNEWMNEWMNDFRDLTTSELFVYTLFIEPYFMNLEFSAELTSQCLCGVF